MNTVTFSLPSFSPTFSLRRSKLHTAVPHQDLKNTGMIHMPWCCCKHWQKKKKWNCFHNTQVLGYLRGGPLPEASQLSSPGQSARPYPHWCHWNSFIRYRRDLVLDWKENAWAPRWLWTLVFCLLQRYGLNGSQKGGRRSNPGWCGLMSLNLMKETAAWLARWKASVSKGGFDTGVHAGVEVC